MRLGQYHLAVGQQFHVLRRVLPNAGEHRPRTSEAPGARHVHEHDTQFCSWAGMEHTRCTEHTRTLRILLCNVFAQVAPKGSTKSCRWHCCHCHHYRCQHSTNIRSSASHMTSMIEISRILPIPRTTIL